MIDVARCNRIVEAMLKRLYVHNFKTFVNFEWRPPLASVVVGPNGAGKSALLEVLWLLQDVIVAGKSIEETSLPSSATAWLSEKKQAIEVEFELESQLFEYQLTCHSERGKSGLQEVLHGNKELLYSTEEGKALLFGDDPPSVTPRTTIPFDRRRSFLAVLEPRPENRRLVQFREAVRSIWAMKPNPLNLGKPAAEEARYLERDLANFADWYRSRVPEDPDAAERLRDDLRETLLGFEQLRLEPITPEVKDLRVRFGFGSKSHELGWAKLSDGQRQLIALYGLLRFGLRGASLVALDEVESFVAPSEIQPWLRAVVDLSATGQRQLLVISHHPEAIDYLAGDSAWRMWRDREAGHSRIAPLAPDRSAGETAYDLVKRGLPED